MKILGHRGARDRASENTLESFDFLVRAGLSASECDVHQLKDGVWAVHHDETLDRTTNGKGPLKAKTWNEIESIRTLDNYRVPRIEELLELLSNKDQELQIELKSSGNLQNLLSIVKEYKNKVDITFISFNHIWLKEIKNSSPDFKTACLLYGLPVNAPEIIKSTNADGISLNVALINKELVESCHKNNFKVTAWNANDQVTFNAIKSLGVDYLATDVPYSAREW